MSWFGWGAKPKTDKDLMEKEMSKKDKQYCAMMEAYFKNRGYENELKQLYPDTLQRFVQGYAHCVQREKETKERIHHFLNTYRKFNFATMLDNTDTDEAKYADAWPLFSYGYDKYGHPVYYDCVGDSKEEMIGKVFKITDINDASQYHALMQYKYTFMKRLHNCKRIQSDKHKKLIYKHVLIFDVKNVKFSISEFTGMKSQFAKKVIGSDQDMFPDTLYRMFIINASMAFRALWAILRAFCDPITSEKIQVLGTDYMKYLTKQVSIDQIPVKYGGKGKWDIRHGFVADLQDDHYPMREEEKEKEKENESESKNSGNGKSNASQDDTKQDDDAKSEEAPQPNHSDNIGNDDKKSNDKSTHQSDKSNEKNLGQKANNKQSTEQAQTNTDKGKDKDKDNDDDNTWVMASASGDAS